MLGAKRGSKPCGPGRHATSLDPPGAQVRPGQVPAEVLFQLVPPSTPAPLLSTPSMTDLEGCLTLSTPRGSLRTLLDLCRLPESPMPQAQSSEESQRPQTGDKLANGVSPEKVAWNLASRLYHLEGFRKSEVAAHLQKK